MKTIKTMTVIAFLCLTSFAANAEIEMTNNEQQQLQTFSVEAEMFDLFAGDEDPEDTTVCFPYPQCKYPSSSVQSMPLWYAQLIN